MKIHLGMMSSGILFLRIALASAFLSAVADRFGLWGGPGAPGVSWGNWENFLAYTAKLTWFLPTSLVPAAGWIATAAEILLAGALIVGLCVRWAAFASSGLLLIFAVSMTVALGIKAPMDYSVFTAAASAFVLATLIPKTEPALTHPMNLAGECSGR